MIIAAAMVLLSCKKLNSSTLFLSTFCPECSDEIENELTDIEGIYFVGVDLEKSSLIVHYENKEGLDLVESWLTERRLLGDSTSWGADSLDCCISP